MALYICNNCGYGSQGYLGKCPDCGEFGTFLLQKKEEVYKSTKVSNTPFDVTELKNITVEYNKRIQTKIHEFDRVLGGGFVAGEVILLSGEPGVGKSTLLLQSLQHIKSLYISGEEGFGQIKDRANRLNIETSTMLLSNVVELGSIVEGIKDLHNKIDLVVIDSLQTIQTGTDNTFGSISTLKEAIQTLVNLAKHFKLPMVIIGHVTKDGDIAGPKMIEHMVDAVLTFEGEEISEYRILRATKNRYGDPYEIGVFEMKEEGLIEVNNPLALIENDISASGKSLISVQEGKRIMFYEVQTLAVETTLPVPRRVAKGIDYNKLLLLLAIIRKYLHLPMDTYDIYVNIAGGAKVISPAADLGIIASILSSLTGKSSDISTVFSGEVGLLGDVKESRSEKRIITECKRLGFKHIISGSTLKHIKEIKQVIK